MSLPLGTLNSLGNFRVLPIASKQALKQRTKTQALEVGEKIGVHRNCPLQVQGTRGAAGVMN